MKPILYKLTCVVVIGNLEFKEIGRVLIKSTWKQLTDTCDIKLPKNLRLKGKAVSEYIKRGDKVVVKLGYNGNLNTEFEGFVREVETDVPLRVHCEDFAFKTKYYRPKNKLFTNAKLGDVVSHVVDGIEGVKLNVTGDVGLGKLLIEDATTVKVLEVLRQNYGLASFFKSDTLHVGFPYKSKPTANACVYDFQNNVIPGHSLKYRKSENVKVKIKAIANLDSGKKLTVEVGEDGGSIVTRNFPHIGKGELEKLAKEELKKYKVGGFSGSLTGWGEPFVSHGDSVVLTDSEHPDRKGKYLVDATEVSFTNTVFRRKVSIGQKVG
ncbi:hypothetical protein [uncultured Microscilla sp.]|uniref:hypothetical protein n=1 Tax=uncultured Microscilla sp. TaxID=432653 RepID=UPI002613633C|nr:hypothetical protein [uncultured Microscilla sp.]